MHHTDGILSSACKNHRLFNILLALIWILGIILGFYFAFQATVSVSHLMLSVIDSRLSIVGLLFVLIFPLLFVFVVLRLSRPLLVLPVIFTKAFFFSCCVFSVAFASGDAGWLVRWLFIFSDSCSVIVLLWFSFRNMAENREGLRTDFLISLIISAAIGCIDYFLVSPFAMMLFDHL